MTNLPLQFQAAVVEDSTGQPVLAHSAAVPKLRPGTLLIKTTAVAINPSDYKIGSNSPAPGAIVGMDFAGKIVQMDVEAKELRPDLALGDTVCGFVHGSNPTEPDNGSFAEYLRAHSQLVFRVPSGMEAGEAATMGVALATAALSLWNSLKLPASPSAPLAPTSAPVYVLVYGASTASGTMLLQLLKLYDKIFLTLELRGSLADLNIPFRSGYTPIATCSPRNFNLVKSYGAAHVFDHADGNTAEAIRQVTKKSLEYAVDCITDNFSVECCYAAMARTGGRCVTLEMCSDAMRPKRRSISQEMILALDIFGEPVKLNHGYERNGSPALREFAVHWYKVFQGLINDGKLHAHPLHVLDSGFQNVVNGIRLLKTGSISGKKIVCFLE
ncbi:MAG: putative secondary metabolism biosynthetic enzyme [Bogoriella megaspora]|nr:MAG: putative secondary metabolism biosynthetic enzyme [Bogoriella megaspora]